MDYLQDKTLRLKAKGLMTLLISLQENNAICSIDELAAMSKDGLDSVRTALKDIEQAGYLLKKRQRDKKGRFGKAEYEIKKYTITKKPQMEKPTLEKPKIDDKQRVFGCYSNNIHPISGIIETDKLTDCIKHYGADVCIKAIEKAVAGNVRTLSYIEGILRRWGNQGFKGDTKPKKDYGINF